MRKMACDEKNFENHIWLVVSKSVSLQDTLLKIHRIGVNRVSAEEQRYPKLVTVIFFVFRFQKWFQELSVHFNQSSESIYCIFGSLGSFWVDEYEIYWMNCYIHKKLVKHWLSTNIAWKNVWTASCWCFELHSVAFCEGTSVCCCRVRGAEYGNCFWFHTWKS